MRNVAEKERNVAEKERNVAEKDVLALVAEWREIESKVGGCEHSQAAYAVKVRSLVGECDDFRVFFWNTLGVRSSSRIEKFRRMARAVSLVPDVKVWRAVGWEGVREIVRIEDSTRRTLACSRLVAERAKGGMKVGVWSVEKILADVAPEIFLPRPAEPETPKDRAQTRMAADAQSDAHQQAREAKDAHQQAREALVVASNVTVERERDVLRAALRRIVEGSPIFLGLLNDEEKKAAGLTTTTGKKNRRTA